METVVSSCKEKCTGIEPTGFFAWSCTIMQPKTGWFVLIKFRSSLVEVICTLHSFPGIRSEGEIVAL